MKQRLALIVLLALLGACSSAPPPSLPPAEEAAIVLDQRGQDAFRRGDMNTALAAYEEALRLYSSVENAAGAAVELLNIATVHHQLGQRERAIQSLDDLLTLRTAVPARLKVEAAYRRAYFDFDVGNFADAVTWLERAQEWCANDGCDAAGRIQNLQARLAFARGDVAAAERDARRGLEQNRRRADAIEEANSLRILADAAARRGQAAQAFAFYEQALALDKQAAQPRKIALDLLGASRSLVAQGKSAEAIDYAQRALRVAESVGDERGREEAKALLQSLSR